MDHIEAEAYQVTSTQLLLERLQREIRAARAIVINTQWDFYGTCSLGCGGNRATGHIGACSIGKLLDQTADHNPILTVKLNSVS